MVKRLSDNTSNTLKTQLKTLSDVTLCPNCSCMTHTVDGKCGKCNADKGEPVSSDDVLRTALTKLCWVTDPSGTDDVENVMQLIHSYGDTREIDGRIAELERLKAPQSMTFGERLAELKKMKGE